jgi:hypothetical protein
METYMIKPLIPSYAHGETRGKTADLFSSIFFGINVLPAIAGAVCKYSTPQMKDLMI